MFEKGKVYASGSNKSSDRVGVFQKGKVYEGGGGNLYDMQQLIDKTVTNPTEAFRQNAGGNPIPHINPQGGVVGTKKEAEEYAKKATAGDGFEGLSLDELKKRLDSEKEVYERTKGNAVTNILDFIGSDWFSKNGSFNKTEEYKNQ